MLLNDIDPDPLPEPQSLPGRVPFHLSPDGRTLAVTVIEPHHSRTSRGHTSPRGVSTYLDGSRVVLVDTATGETREPFPAGSTSWGPQWSPDGRSLAALIEHEGPPCVVVWDVASGSVRFFWDARVTSGFEYEIARWMPDGKRLVVKLAPEGPGSAEAAASVERHSPSIEVLSYDPALAKEQAGTPVDAEFREGSWGDLGLLDADSGEVRRLALGWEFDTFRVAPDGKAIAVLRTVSDPENPVRQAMDLVVIEVKDGQTRQVAPRVMAGIGYGCLFNWSPDSRRIAFYHIEEGRPSQLWVVAADGSSPPGLTSGDADLELPEDEYYHPPRWSVDGLRLYVLWRAIWVFDLDGGAYQRIAPDLGRLLRSWVQPPNRLTLQPIDGRFVLMTTTDRETKKDGLARIELETGEGELLSEFDHMWQDHVWGREEPWAMELAADGSVCYLAEQGSDHPPRVWRLRPPFRTGEVLLALPPDTRALKLGTVRLIEYRTVASGSKTRRAILTLPSGYREGERLPVVVNVYHGAAISGWVYRLDTAAHTWARRGYACLRPDISFGEPGLLRHLAGEVVPAVNHLIDLGIADPERVCLFGHSRGGYDALALVTQTGVFCAAVVSAGLANLATVGFGMEDYRCPGTVWEHRDDYIENSPFFYLDRVRTPVLLISGTAEMAEEMEARRTYAALRRLGKRVELRLYRDEDHSPEGWTAPSRRDVESRIREWFDTFTSRNL